MIGEKEQEELLVLVTELTERYTSKESTSIPYEKARMLMDAILYCIEETERADRRKGSIVANTEGNLRNRYEKGYELVIEKVKRTKEFYNQFIPHFSSYGNQCYYDTIVKGLPQFFFRYDARFCPQDHLLTLDYPVLKPLEERCGIDRMEEYLFCVALEQSFLHPIGEASIIELLSYYEYEVSEAIINVCSPILRYKIALKIIGGKLESLKLGEYGLKQLGSLAQKKTSGELLTLCRESLYDLIRKEYEGQEDLFRYLLLDLQDFVVELKNAAKYQNLQVLFPV